MTLITIELACRSEVSIRKSDAQRAGVCNVDAYGRENRQLVTDEPVEFEK